MRKWSLSDLALNRPVSTGMIIVALIVLGTISLFKLPLGFLPAESTSRIYIWVQVPRTSPEILEREVIRPLEETIAGVRGLHKMRVTSGSWGIRFNLNFNPGTDIQVRKLEIRERLDRARAKLSDLVERTEVGSSSGSVDEPLLHIQLASDRDLKGAYYQIRQEIARPIERLDGVARVELSGIQPHELEIAVELDAGTRRGIDLSTIHEVVRGAQNPRSLGILRSSRTRANVHQPQVPSDEEHYRSLPIPSQAASSVPPSSSSGNPPSTLADRRSDRPETGSISSLSQGQHLGPRLGEVAQVSLHPQEGRRSSRLNGRPAIQLDVYASAGASTVDVSRRVRELLDKLRLNRSSNSTLGDLDIEVFSDQGELILETLGDLRNTGIFGGIIGSIVLFGFLHRLRTTLVAAACIPLSILMTCGVLLLQDSEINCVVLLGLVLGIGMLIDNAVVIVEAISLHFQRGKSPVEATRLGAREVGLATVASTLSTVIVFLPLIFTDHPSPMFSYLRPLGMTFVTALLASLLASQCLIPLITKRLSSNATRATKHPMIQRLSKNYGRLISQTLRWPRCTLLLGLALCASAWLPISNLNINLDDTEEKTLSLPVILDLSGSRDYRRVENHIIAMEEALLPKKQALGIRSMACYARDWRGNCDIFPEHAIDSEHAMSDFQDQIRQELPEQPGIRYRVGESQNHFRSNRDPRVVEFVLRGDDMETLIDLSRDLSAFLQDKLQSTLSEHGGLDRVIGPYNDGARELHIRPDNEKLNAYGLNPQTLARLVTLAFQGQNLGQTRGPDGEIRLRLSTAASQPIPHHSSSSIEGTLTNRPAETSEKKEHSRNNDSGPTREDLYNLPIPLPSGIKIPLSNLATIELERSPYWVQRVNRQTELRMQVRFLSAVDPVKNRKSVHEALDAFSFPTGYSSGQRTQWWKRDNGTSELLVNLGLCLLLVYAVMASLFESYLQPAGILLICLVGCIGAPWAMWLTQTTLDTVAVIGLFILIGIVVNNGIMLVDKVTQYRNSGMNRSEALRLAGQDRLRPIMMTASTTIFGLVPMLIHHPTIAGIYYHSIAIMIAGGLISSTIITLIFLPSAYVLLEDFATSLSQQWKRFS